MRAAATGAAARGGTPFQKRVSESCQGFVLVTKKVLTRLSSAVCAAATGASAAVRPRDLAPPRASAGSPGDSSCSANAGADSFCSFSASPNACSAQDSESFS